MRNKSNTRKPSGKAGGYKVNNWSEYNRSLKNRGSITLWLSEDAIESWHYKGKKQKGGQLKYSDQYDTQGISFTTEGLVGLL